MTAVNVLGVNRTIVGAGIGGTSTTTTGTGGVQKILSGLLDARVKVSLDYYTIGGSTEVTGSTVKLFSNLPAGANVVRIVLYASSTQTALTLSVGDGASATRYASSSSTAATMSSVAPFTIEGSLYVIGTNTNDNYILLTTGGATMTAGVLYGAIYYTID